MDHPQSGVCGQLWTDLRTVAVFLGIVLISLDIPFESQSQLKSKLSQTQVLARVYLAGDEGFEPPITGPEPGALPLGQSPIT